MTDDLQVRKRPAMTGSGRFAKKKSSHIQDLERRQRMEERDITYKELSEEEDESDSEEIPVLVPIPEKKGKTSRSATILVATLSLLIVMALAAAITTTYYPDSITTTYYPDSTWLRRPLLLRLLTSTADDVENHRKYDSVDYTPELNEWIQGDEKTES